MVVNEYLHANELMIKTMKKIYLWYASTNIT